MLNCMLYLLICPSIYIAPLSSSLYLISNTHIQSSLLSLSFEKTLEIMASRGRSSRSRHPSSPAGGSTRISEDQLSDLLSKLQHLIPEARSRRSGNRVSASKVLQDTCNYIKSLHQEVDDLSERLADILASMDVDNAQAAIIRSLLM